MNMQHLHKKPLKLKRNRVSRPFKGGKLLDEWQGVRNPRDSHTPEQWVASTIEARNSNPIPNEGLSIIDTGRNELVFLKDVITSDPEAFLGRSHVHKYGDNMAVLVKVIDSYSRLLIQVHPDRTYAKEIMNSKFGKTEAWYILKGREINGEEPYVLFGFKKGITRQKWEELFQKQDIEGMVNCLHKFIVKPGDVFLVEGGVPHAAGAGVFFMEIQEPTDITMRTERLSASGDHLPDFQLHQGVGFEKMFDCFHYDGYTKEEISERWCIKPSIKSVQTGGREVYVISPLDSPYFSMTRIEIDSNYMSISEETFSIAVVLEGTGKLIYNDGEMEIRQSDEIFLPAGLGNITWKCHGSEKLIIVKSYPPQ